MLIRMRHWNINLRQQSRSSLIAGSLHNEIHINTVHVKSSMTATQQAIGKGQKKDIRDWSRGFRLPSWPDELAGSFPDPTSWHTKTETCPVPQSEKLPPVFCRNPPGKSVQCLPRAADALQAHTLPDTAVACSHSKSRFWVWTVKQGRLFADRMSSVPTFSCLCKP